MDAPRQGHGPEDAADGTEQDGAERAFEALREEVAALRRGVELVYRQAQQATHSGPGAPDYSLTLGKMEKALGTIAGRLEAVERQPALRLTPASFEAEIETAARIAAVAVSRPFNGVANEVHAAARTLETLIKRIQERREQRVRLWVAGGCGMLGGVLLWFMLAALLPWGGGDWLASLPIVGGGPWQAGQALLRRDNPQLWRA